MDKGLQPKPNTRKGFIPRAVLWTSLVFFVLFFFDWVLFEALARLAFGWLVLLRENVAEIHIVPHRIASALIMATLAVAGLHFLAVRWRRWSNPGATPWRWDWSVSTSAILLSTALAAMAVAGAAHQAAWLKGEQISESRITHARKFNVAKQLALLAFEFSEKHHGKFPDDITTLIKEELGSRNDPWISHFLLYEESEHTTPEPWLYFGAGRFHREGESFLLFAAPRPGKAGRVVVDTGGRAATIPEDEFQALLANLPPRAPSSETHP